MNEYVLGISACVFLILFLMTGIEIAFGIVLVGVAGLIITSGFSVAFNTVTQDFYDTLGSYGLTVIPLFMLMGQIAFHAGIAQRLYDAAYKLVGRVPGGLAMATVLAATMFKAMCGSTFATSATFSSVAIPQMSRYNYSKRLSTGIVADVGTIGMLIPPSISMIIYGIITEQSIGRLFLAGIIPGLMIAGLFIAVIYVWSKINPKLAPPSTETFSMKDKLRSLPEFVSVVVIFGVVIGGLMAGMFTPTEAGTIGTIAIFILAVIKKGMSFKIFAASVDESMTALAHDPHHHCLFCRARSFPGHHADTTSCGRLANQSPSSQGPGDDHHLPFLSVRWFFYRRHGICHPHYSNPVPRCRETRVRSRVVWRHGRGYTDGRVNHTSRSRQRLYREEHYRGIF